MKMKPGIWTLAGRLAPLSGLVLAAAISLTPAQASDESGSGKIAGTWFTQVSIRDCKTGAVLRTFPALNIFAAGGTLIDTTTFVSPALRSPGMGTWAQAGRQTFNATSLAFLFSPAFAWTGTQKLTDTIELKGDVLEFTSTNQIFDTNGTVIATGCATAVGHRM